MHRIRSGPLENDIDVLEGAVKQIEAKGEELVAAPIYKWLDYPVGEWLVLTRKAGKAASSSHARAEKRAQ